MDSQTKTLARAQSEKVRKFTTEINLKSSWQREGGRLPKLFWNIPKQTNATLLVSHQTRTKTFYMDILDCEKVRKFTTEINLKSSWQRDGGREAAKAVLKHSKANLPLHSSLHTRLKRRPFTWTVWIVRRFGSSQQNYNLKSLWQREAGRLPKCSKTFNSKQKLHCSFHTRLEQRPLTCAFWILKSLEIFITTEINLRSSWQREGGRLPKLFWNIPRLTNATSLVAH